MKVWKNSSIFAFLLMAHCHGIAIPDGVTENEEAKEDPCAVEEVVDEEAPVCLSLNKACTNDPDGCCGNLKCAGYSFFKKCVEPVACHDVWHDCSDGIECCDGFQCVEMENGKLECGVPKIGQRTVEIGDFNIEAEPEPTDPPAPINLKTTKVPGAPVTFLSASSNGDPHIKTFDGLKYDCQGHGEHILSKSLVTRREIQARYEHMGVSKPISIAKGVAVQDEGDTPLVEVSLAKNKDTLGNDMGDGSTLLFFVNREQKDLFEPYDDGQVSVAIKNKKITIKYHESGMEVIVSYFRNRFNIAVKMPDSDLVVGVLGTNNRKFNDEWMLPDKSVVEIPAGGGKLRKPGYDFCTQHYCNRDAKLSLFTYVEKGIDFESYERCDLPYGNTLDKYLDDVPQWVINVCGAHDMACIMDTMNGDIEDAIELRRAALLTADVCSPPGGSCDERECCGESKCQDFGGLVGKVCDGDLTLGVPEFGSCTRNPKCTEGLTCIELQNGDKQCRELLECQLDYMSCNANDDCCGGSVCIENKNTGIKQCRKLPSCMKKWDDCSLVGCCGNLKCVAEGAGKVCKDIPGCWNKKNKDCSDTPCCDGLTCVEDGNKKLCKKLPKCAAKNRDCRWIPCCEDDDKPLQCVEFIDRKGKKGRQCKLVPGDAEIRLFEDTNGNGVLDDGEEGLAGVAVRLVDHKTKKPFKNSSNGGNIHEVIETDVKGLVKFKSVPKDVPVRVEVVKKPAGAVQTRNAPKGTDPTKNSDWDRNGFSRSFSLKEKGVYKNTALGYLMPVDVEIEVFNDINGNGLHDEGEGGIKDVKLRLETRDPKSKKFKAITNLGTGGTAHQVLTTGADGKVIFTGLPQNMKIRAKVIQAPAGAIPTKQNVNRNKNEEDDSDLRRDGSSDEFQTKGDDDGYITKLDLGYRMPETVKVRVWDDTDGDGKQDHGENGIAGVKLQLVEDKTKKGLKNTGGNSHTSIKTDEDGIATFTKVPQGLKLRVKVLEKPKGAVKTKSNQGGEDVDSDLDKDDLSYSFVMTSTGAPFDSVDLGYKLAGSMVVRVWDDENANGLQDEGEVGLEGVKLRLVTKKNKKRLSNLGGNSHKDIKTDKDGYATFTSVPQNVDLRVQVIDQPKGAIPTKVNANRHKNMEEDSDLGKDGLSDSFKMTAGDYTEIDLGYKMPEEMVVHVWDDENNNGLQDDGEAGIEGVKLVLVQKRNKKRLKNYGNGGNCHKEIKTDENGNAVFTKVPKGEELVVKVLNTPKGAVMTQRDAGKNKNDTEDSDFNTKGFSNSFNLRNFVGSSFSSVDLGYKMPDDLEVFVWDDVNLNGLQDENEPGIEGVQLQLIDDKSKKALKGYKVLETDETGKVVFPKVTKAVKFRVKVLNPPKGAVATTRNQKKQGGTEANDSDLNGGKMYTDAFSLVSFTGEMFGKIDLGFRMPDDTEIRVWDDVNGNGIQEEGEPGIEGVKVKLLNAKGNKSLKNIGGGSNAHKTVTTDANGIAKFEKVPKAMKLKAKVLNAPPGSVNTKQANLKKTEATEETDSDLRKDMTSNTFSLSSFKGAGAYGSLDLGFKMPKTMVVRAWNDKNKNGIQDEDEENLVGVKFELRLQNKKKLPKQGPNSTANKVAETDDTGRAVIYEVPQGIKMRLYVTKKPDNYKAVSPKRKGGDRQLDSDLNKDMYTDVFQLPNNVDEKFDLVDFGFVLAE